MKLKIHYFNPMVILRACRSLYLSRSVTEKKIFIPIRVGTFSLGINIKKHPSASFIVNGKLRIAAYQNGNESISIFLGKNSRLIVDGDFIIGNGTRIFLDNDAFLYIGGKKNESDSGITEKTRIMVRKSVHIGADCIIAWNVLITDCDWHEIEGKPFQKDVFIGNHVWVAGDSSILKGAKIGDGCIVGTHSVVMNQSIPDQCLVGGNPARVLSRNVIWHRDMAPTQHPAS